MSATMMISTTSKPRPKYTPTPLCLACASSLPPRLSASKIHITACCARPICPACLESNPRLALYNPCLACQSGVGATAGWSSDKGVKDVKAMLDLDLDARVKEEDMYQIGEDDQEDVNVDATESKQDLPPAYSDLSNSSSTNHPTSSNASPPFPPTEPTANTTSTHTSTSTSTKRIYHLKPSDTLNGLALRFKTSPLALCRLNHLPPSTMTTQPHILHTRTSLILPPDANGANGEVTTGLKTLVFDAGDDIDEKGVGLEFIEPIKPVEPETPAQRIQREQKRARERAAVRMATLTKEADPAIVLAYVSLAESHDLDDDETADEAYARRMKAKELGTPAGAAAAAGGLEGAAVDAYLEDEEWEADMRRRGMGPRGREHGQGQGSSSSGGSGVRGVLGRVKVW